MDKELQQIERIERYFFGELSAADEAELIKQRETDADFDALCKEMKTIMDGVTYAVNRRNAFVSYLNGLAASQPDPQEVPLSEEAQRILKASFEGQEEDSQEQLPAKEQKGRQRFFSPKVVAVAASVAVLLVAGFIFLKLNQNDQLYGNYYQGAYSSLDASQSIRSSEENADRKSTAFNLYNAERFNEAIEIFEQLVETDRDTNMMFYLAQSYMADNQHEKALLFFEELIENDTNLKLQSQWYLGLCYLKLDQKEKAVAIFEDLAETESTYAPKAKEILYSLKAPFGVLQL